MPLPPILIFMVIFCLESLVAMLKNGFIVTVLGREWKKSRALPSGDMIVACLAASRFCLHGLATLNDFLISFLFCYRNNHFGILWDFINTVTFWLTTWLAIFYCVKISSFSHPIFLWLKWRISRSVPRLLLVSIVIGGLSVISTATGQTIASQMMVSYENCTVARMMTFYQYFYRCHVMLMWVTPFLLFLMSIILLMFSLYRHVGQMRDHRPGPHDPSTQAHTMALKSLAFFFIFYTSYFLFLVVSATQIIVIQNFWYWAWEVITYAGISIHSTILMLSSPKLRKAFKMKFSDLCAAIS
uniref:Taste receptor type 2 n=1 Tax=Nannospalax galili TaxID=1026970 RepID=A0A0N9NW38_NANGA|nr:taste receptor type 2 member 20 [Nannospalax galili]ALG92637.1 taste receptor type 2 member 20 [Nannospalax galili]ALG92639.1 taste receptor type 2 member 20 [Nannospalax galili]ALG92643.1 taste receptor type 2 member 20 [Nannospalax galili]ALG92649.1 taste receptor type 2 member 20 [Nannospalax galili]